MMAGKGGSRQWCLNIRPLKSYAVAIVVESSEVRGTRFICMHMR
jgi:hypothetical protein